MKCETCGKDYTEMPYRPALYGDMDRCANKEHWHAWNQYEAWAKYKGQECKGIIELLKHPAGFDLGCGGMLCLRPVSEDVPPTKWEVDWNKWGEDPRNLSWAHPYAHHEEFDNLEEAVKFFVEKRHEMKLGLDLEKAE